MRFYTYEEMFEKKEKGKQAFKNFITKYDKKTVLDFKKDCLDNPEFFKMDYSDIRNYH